MIEHQHHQLNIINNLIPHHYQIDNDTPLDDQTKSTLLCSLEDSLIKLQQQQYDEVDDVDESDAQHKHVSLDLTLLETVIRRTNNEDVATIIDHIYSVLISLINDQSLSKDNILIHILKAVYLFITLRYDHYVTFTSLGIHSLMNKLVMANQWSETVKGTGHSILDQMQLYKRNTKVHQEKSVVFDKLNGSGSRVIKISQLCYGDAGLGWKIWDSSLALAEIIIANASRLSNTNVLELGSGCGLTGLVASLYCRKILMTDYVDNVLENIGLNVQRFQQEQRDLGHIDVCKLDWSDDDHQLGEFDWIIGSDLIYTQSAANRLPSIIHRHLHVGGTAILVLPACREGIALFEENVKGGHDLEIVHKQLIDNQGDDGTLLCYIIVRLR
ncbi:hypothetical protein SAMD00019534_018090, partial [Acytostelium subglobosum LB1]|uniref:hypothetical protein n=1 Tax=Acytostelium subglobosum LB1 TaxID=1410327 RepID=UPI000644ED60